MSEQADRDALIEAVGAAIWQANNELTKPEYRHMPDAEARTYFAHAAMDAALASDWLAQRDRRVAAEALREAAMAVGDYWCDPAVSDEVIDWLRERADRIERGE